MFLRGHTFKTTKVGRPGVCYLMCEEELTCQSYNFVIGHKICELNNRTKEARPEDFKPDRTRFYMKRARNRGTLQFFFRVCLSFKCSHLKCQPVQLAGWCSQALCFGREASNGRCEAARRIGSNKALSFSTQPDRSCPDQFSQPSKKVANASAVKFTGAKQRSSLILFLCQNIVVFIWVKRSEVKQFGAHPGDGHVISDQEYQPRTNALVPSN